MGCLLSESRWTSVLRLRIQLAPRPFIGPKIEAISRTVPNVALTIFEFPASPFQPPEGFLAKLHRIPAKSVKLTHSEKRLLQLEFFCIGFLRPRDRNHYRYQLRLGLLWNEVRKRPTHHQVIQLCRLRLYAFSGGRATSHGPWVTTVGIEILPSLVSDAAAVRWELVRKH